MRISQASLGAALTVALGTSLTQAQYLINELSLGYTGTMGKDGVIPNFALVGSPQTPEVLSNKIILTPVAPGNQRASVWSSNKLMHSTWIADVDFRANGPDRGGGNLNIWLTSGGSNDVGLHSAYTVGRFDGLVLVVDTYGGSGGMIRGFLNDRTTDFGAQGDIAGLAFGHCQYAYRNLGRPSQIKMRQTADKFSVEVDGTPCFATDKVKVPLGYQFGVTAASADNPDSFELFKLVQGEAGANQGSVGNEAAQKEKAKQQQQQQQQERQQKKRDNAGGGGGGWFSKDTSKNTPLGDGDSSGSDEDPFDIKDQSAETFTSSAEHNVFRTVSKHARSGEQSRAEVSRLIDTVRLDVVPRLDHVRTLEAKVAELEREIKALRGDVGQQVKSSERAIKGVLEGHHRSLSGTIADAVPGHGKLIAVIVGSQLKYL
ncbi:Protein ERGIC-53 like protein [Verticillium longisporum]|nr:Protein ERGIC-53 like protein [Verticillium longisporum]